MGNYSINIVDILSEAITKEYDLFKLALISEKLPQTEIETIEELKDGIYTRTIKVPPNTFIIGKKHKEAYFEVCLKGKLLLYDGGEKGEVSEGFSRIVKAGSMKAAYTLKETVWKTVHKVKAKTKKEAYDETVYHNNLLVDDSIKDFKYFIEKYDLTEDMIDDYMKRVGNVSTGHENFYIASSDIQGKGVFSSTIFVKGEPIGLALFDGKRTELARYVNHSIYPNARVERLENNDIIVIADRLILETEEITFDYKNNMEVLK